MPSSQPSSAISIRGNKRTLPASGTSDKSPKRPRVNGNIFPLTDPSMPSNVLFLIFSNLDPWSLLQIVRTNKYPGELFLRGKQAKLLWRTVRCNVSGLPEKPMGISEPRYASLFFDKHCELCLRATTLVQWALDTRCCSRCLNTNKMQKAGSGLAKLYHVPTLKRLKKERKQLRNKSVAALSKWDQKQSDITLAKLQHAKESRAAELVSIRKERLEEIIKRLRALGWGYQIDRMPLPRLASHKLIARARPLTEQNWKKIQSHLVEFMEEIKRSSRICGCGVKGQFSAMKATKVEYWELDGLKAVYGPFEADCGAIYGGDGWKRCESRQIDNQEYVALFEPI
ncbi:hypothetical protein DFS33DRAFT_1277428 [Desarmillaria ectypa]|nr:hypothetical protein DFS33DRAFT_1277428 [Desarmillaria ectypa]